MTRTQQSFSPSAVVIVDRLIPPLWKVSPPLPRAGQARTHANRTRPLIIITTTTPRPKTRRRYDYKASLDRTWRWCNRVQLEITTTTLVPQPNELHPPAAPPQHHLTTFFRFSAYVLTYMHSITISPPPSLALTDACFIILKIAGFNYNLKLLI